MGAVKRTHQTSRKYDDIRKKYRGYRKSEYCITRAEWFKMHKMKRLYPNGSHIQSEILKSFRIPYKYWRKNEKELDALYKIWDDAIINGTSTNIQEPVGLLSHALIPQPKIRPIVIATNPALTLSPVIFDEMREYLQNQPDWQEWKKRVLEKWIYSPPSFSDIKIDETADAIRYSVKGVVLNEECIKSYKNLVAE